MGTGILQLRFQKEANTAPFEKNLRIAIYLIPELSSYLDASFPMEISVKYRFLGEAFSAFCGGACIDYLDIDLRSACHLGFTGKVKAAVNALPPLHSLTSYTYAVTIFHVTLHNEDEVLH